MKRLIPLFSKTEICAIVTLLWTIACLLVYCGFAKTPSDGVAEKMYSVEVMLVTYYFSSRRTTTPKESE